MSNLFLFPDNTVLCNFGAIGRLDLLKTVLNGRGRWVEAIAYEASRSAMQIPALASVQADGWLGDPIEISEPALVTAIDRTRRVVFGGTDDEPLKHLGEAQTCELLRGDPEYLGSSWISDDQEALRYARAHRIEAHETIWIVQCAVADGDLSSEAEGFELMQSMVEADRSLRMPSSAAELR